MQYLILFEFYTTVWQKASKLRFSWNFFDNFRCFPNWVKKVLILYERRRPYKLSSTKNSGFDWCALSEMVEFFQKLPTILNPNCSKFPSFVSIFEYVLIATTKNYSANPHLIQKWLTRWLTISLIDDYDSVLWKKILNLKAIKLEKRKL